MTIGEKAKIDAGDCLCIWMGAFPFTGWLNGSQLVFILLRSYRNPQNQNIRGHDSSSSSASFASPSGQTAASQLQRVRAANQTMLHRHLWKRWNDAGHPWCGLLHLFAIEASAPSPGTQVTLHRHVGAASKHYQHPRIPIPYPGAHRLGC